MRRIRIAIDRFERKLSKAGPCTSCDGHGWTGVVLVGTVGATTVRRVLIAGCPVCTRVHDVKEYGAEGGEGREGQIGQVGQVDAQCHDNPAPQRDHKHTASELPIPSWWEMV